MTTKLPIDPNNLPVNTGNLYPPVLLTGLTNGIDYTVTIIAHLADGTTITESRTVKPHADPAPNPPTILTKNGLGLTGTGIPGFSIKLYDSNGVLVTEVEIDGNGNWSIPTALFPSGTTVGFTGSITVTDINGNESSPTMIDSIDSIPPTSPTNITANGSGLSGTAEPGATVYLLDANGNIITSVLVDSTGHWFIPAASFPNGVISPFNGSIKVVDPAGNESAIVYLNLNIDITPPFAPIPIVQNATGLNGVTEPNAIINLIDSNGNIIASVVADNSGFWTIPSTSFPSGTSNGFNGSIVAVDAAGNISQPTTIHTIDGLAPNQPVITTANASGLFGTAEANTTIKLFNDAGLLVYTTITDVLGNWSFLPDKFPNGINGFTGTLTSTDLVNNVSTATVVSGIDGIAPNPPVITIANASGLFGTAEANATIIMYNSFGILVNGTISNNLGNWSILPNRFPGNATNGFSGNLTQTDVAGNVSTQTTIQPIDGIIPNAPNYLVANYYGISGTAEAGTRVSLKDNTGTVAFTFADMNGNWFIPANSFPRRATNQFIGSITSTDSAGNESPATTVTAIHGVLPIAALTSYTDNVGSIQSTSSTAATTDDKTPGINIGTSVVAAQGAIYIVGAVVTPAIVHSGGTNYTEGSVITPANIHSNLDGYIEGNVVTPAIIQVDTTITPSLYINGVLTPAIYDTNAGTLTPNIPLTNGTYNFTYTLTDSDGNVSLPSPALTITVDTVAPATPSKPSSYVDNVGNIQSDTSTAATTDDTTPSINIGTSLTDTPKLYINNALVTSTYNSSTGTLTPNTALVEGSYDFSYTLTDAAGNESAKSPTYSIIVDLTPPATPTAPTTYVDNVGSITSNTSVAPMTDDTTPGINIGAGLINTPKLYVGGILTVSTYDPISGTLTPNAALVEGVNVITYSLTDAAGNESGQSPSIIVTVDTIPPSTTTIASYVDNVGNSQSTTSVEISTDDTTPGLNIGTGLTTIPKLYIGGILTAATYNSIVGTLTPNVALSQGTYSFTYTLTDIVGNESLPSAAYSITIDTTAPTTPVTAITSYVDNVGSIQSISSTAIITDDTTPGINVGTGLTDTVKLYVNESLSLATYDVVTGTLTPLYPLATGTYRFTYTLTDSVGNESGQSPSISITIDITPPTTPNDKPYIYVDNVGSIQSTTSNAAITDDTTPGINIGAGLANTPKLYVNGVYTPATYVTGTGIVTPDSPLTDGLKTITYTLSDVAGNESGQSPAITLTIDTVAPSVSTPTSFLDNVGPYQFTNSTLSITDDNRPGINIGTGLTDTVKLYVDGNLTPASYDSVLGTLTPTLAVSDGTHTFAYSLTDIAGNESVHSGTLTLVIDTIPPTTPTTAPASYADNVGYIQSATSTASTTNDTTPGINIGSGLIDVPSLYINGVLTAATYNSVAGTLTPTVALTEGTYNFTYALRDAAGNDSGQSPALMITIDTTAPDTPLFAPYSYKDQSGVFVTASVVNYITALKVNNYSGITWYRVYATASGQTETAFTTTRTVDPNDSSKVILTFATPSSTYGTLADATWTFKYTILDDAGNESGKSPGISTKLDSYAAVTGGTKSWSTPLKVASASAGGTVTATTESVENGGTVVFVIRKHLDSNLTYRYPADWPAVGSEYTATVSNNTASASIPGADLLALDPAVGYTYAVFATATDLFGNEGYGLIGTGGFKVDFVPVVSGITNISWGNELTAAERAVGGTISVTTSNTLPGSTLTVNLSEGPNLPDDATATANIVSGTTVVTFSSSDLTSLGTYFYDVTAIVSSTAGYSNIYRQSSAFANMP